MGNKQLLIAIADLDRQLRIIEENQGAILRTKDVLQRLSAEPVESKLTALIEAADVAHEVLIAHLDNIGNEVTDNLRAAIDAAKAKP